MCEKDVSSFQISIELLTDWVDAINVFLACGVQTAIAVLDRKRRMR